MDLALVGSFLLFSLLHEEAVLFLELFVEALLKYLIVLRHVGFLLLVSKLYFQISDLGFALS